MPKNYTSEPMGTVDAFTAKGDAVLGHDPETVRAYREQAEEAVRRGPGRIIGQPATQAPAESPQLPMSGVANAVVGKELARLREQAGGLERSIQSPPIGPGGYQVDHLVASHRQMRAELELLREEISRIEGMDDGQVRQLGFKLGAR